ncbi:hypothetical protein AAFF_G00111170 [Aldrovandia affinis]|uniref:Uncharacterized protein n=1 Tax=Aldrovandia affinis TaxID=143900 RepID=A0AAD7WB13_9TELE|nr:hypothetical protein AAFF_G00111170 [Aldrovandia affinis]
MLTAGGVGWGRSLRWRHSASGSRSDEDPSPLLTHFPGSRSGGGVSDSMPKLPPATGFERRVRFHTAEVCKGPRFPASLSFGACNPIAGRDKSSHLRFGCEPKTGVAPERFPSHAISPGICAVGRSTQRRARLGADVLDSSRVVRSVTGVGRRSWQLGPVFGMDRMRCSVTDANGARRQEGASMTFRPRGAETDRPSPCTEADLPPQPPTPPDQLDLQPADLSTNCS